MAVNPDPKPGRWILPLVILGMIGFTYFFVRELPEASPDSTLVAQPTSTTLAETTGTTEAGSSDSFEHFLAKWPCPPATTSIGWKTGRHCASFLHGVGEHSAVRVAGRSIVLS